MSKQHPAGRSLALALAPLGAFVSLVVPAPARAQLLWEGQPAMGEAAFKNFNNDGSATIEPASDPERGMVWRYHKVSGSNRSENHGIRVGGQPYTFQEGTTYYFGWWSKLTSLENNNANFQWKSYENHIQNFPVILKMIGGRMTLQYRPPGQNLQTVWAGPITANTWNHYVLALHLSKDANQGWIEIWFNSKQQTLTNGQMRFNARTYDSGNHNCPKWGIYGAIGSDITNWIDDLKVGMSHASVAADSPGLPPMSDAGAAPSGDAGAADQSADPEDAGGGLGGAGGVGGGGGGGGGSGGASATGGGGGGSGGSGAGTQGSAGRGGSGGRIGGSGSGGMAGAVGGSAPQDPDSMASGCSCETTASTRPPLLWILAVVGALTAMVRRRRPPRSENKDLWS